MKTHYDLLGVRPDADDEALRKAYHKAAKAHHPDLNAGDPDATRRFGQIATAIEILRNPERRAAYDRSLDRERQRRRLWRGRIAIVVANAIGAAVLIVVLARGHALVGPGLSPSSISTSRMVSRVENRAVAGPVAEEDEQRTLGTDPTGGDEPGRRLERGVTVSAVSKLSAETEREAALAPEQDERRQAAEREQPTSEREATLGRERPKAERQAAPRRQQDERRPERKARQLAAAAEAAKSETPPQPVQGAQAASSAASPRGFGPVEIAATRAFTRF
jgi:curved DNA-binding protein CbpA